MNLLLLNPPSLSMYGLFGLTLPPMGLLYVAAALEKAGHDVTLKDMTVDGVVVSRQDFEIADIVGISSDTTRIDKALLLARQAKEAGKTVIMGGPHPQFMAVEILSDKTVDFIVKGEGEAVFPLLLEAIREGNDPGSVSGIMFLKDGKVTETATPAPLDVEQLPLPARHLLDLSPYKAVVEGRPAAALVSSRGCPGACHFCSSSSFFGRGWRARTAESVLAEIDELYNVYGFRAVAFLDDNFTLDPKRVEEIADGIIKRGYDLKWWCFSRADSLVRTPSLARIMAQSGAAMVYLGIESDNAETLNSLGKRSSVAEVEQAVALLKVQRIEVYGSYIIGNLNERPVDIRRTVDLAIRMDTDIGQFSILTPYPGTVLYEQLKDRIFTRKWKFFDGLHLVFRHPLINRHHLQVLLIQAFVRFYRRSAKATQGFKTAGSRTSPSCAKLARCAWEMLV